GHPAGHGGGERLAEERSERDVLPGLDVARGPVVEQGQPEDVVREPTGGDPVAEPGGGADDEPHLGLDVEPAAGSVGRAAAALRSLTARSTYVRARHHDGAGPAVVADREVPPVRLQRLVVG